MGGIINFFIGTATGRYILLGVIVLVSVSTTYAVVHHHIYEEGLVDGKAFVQKQWDAANDAAKKAAEAEAKRTALVSTHIATTATNAATDVHTDADKTLHNDNTVIHYVYLKAPKSAPVHLDGCAYPLDDSVQSVIQADVDKARSAAH